MRFLGIDYGTKKIGLAISDETGSLAFPKDVIQNDPHTLSTIGNIIKEEHIGTIVLGESVTQTGRPNSIGDKINSFKNKLEQQFSLPVFLEKEFFTSIEARKDYVNQKRVNIANKRGGSKKNDIVDDRAAALILQRYLDKLPMSDIGIKKS